MRHHLAAPAKAQDIDYSLPRITSQHLGSLVAAREQAETVSPNKVTDSPWFAQEAPRLSTNSPGGTLSPRQSGTAGLQTQAQG